MGFNKNKHHYEEEEGEVEITVNFAPSQPTPPPFFPHNSPYPPPQYHQPPYYGAPLQPPPPMNYGLTPAPSPYGHHVSHGTENVTMTVEIERDDDHHGCGAKKPKAPSSSNRVSYGFETENFSVEIEHDDDHGCGAKKPKAASSAKHESHGYETETLMVRETENETMTVHEIENGNETVTTVQYERHGSGDSKSKKPTFKVVTKADPKYSLSLRHGKVILAKSDPKDDYQHWYKDEKYSTKVKDEEGCPSFSLINKVTGEALQHSIGITNPVTMTCYDPDELDEFVLWSESKDLGDGYRAIRTVNNVRLNMDAYMGDKHSGGVRDATTIVLWQWNGGDNQRWKITPYSKESHFGRSNQ